MARDLSNSCSWMHAQVVVAQQFGPESMRVTKSHAAVPGSLLTTMPAFKGVVL